MFYRFQFLHKMIIECWCPGVPGRRWPPAVQALSSCRAEAAAAGSWILAQSHCQCHIAAPIPVSDMRAARIYIINPFSQDQLPVWRHVKHTNDPVLYKFTTLPFEIIKFSSISLDWKTF